MGLRQLARFGTRESRAPRVDQYSTYQTISGSIMLKARETISRIRIDPINISRMCKFASNHRHSRPTDPLIIKLLKRPHKFVSQVKISDFRMDA